VLTRGIAAWQALLDERECAIGWRAAEHLRDVAEASPQDARREALARVGTWLGKLPPRLALEQEDAVRVAADRCGYSIDAVQRSFRARYWPEPSRDRSLAYESESPSGVPGREPMEPGPDI
jgi:hypothetical protein